VGRTTFSACQTRAKETSAFPQPLRESFSKKFTSYSWQLFGGKTWLEWYVTKELCLPKKYSSLVSGQGQLCTAIQSFNRDEILAQSQDTRKKKSNQCQLITICGVAQTLWPMNHVNELSELEKFSTFRVRL